MAKSIDIVAIGEPLMEFSELCGEKGRSFLPGLGGDTCNVAVAARRQGARVAYATRLGGDAFGREFVALWEAEGIDHSAVVIDEDAKTGIYFITHGPEGHEFTYWRAGSGSSRMGNEDVPAAMIADARVLHISGISQAISDKACDSCFHAIDLARKAGTAISYDTNLRLRLWPLERARAIIHAAVALSDIVLPGLDDAQQLTGLQTPEEIVDFYLKLGPSIVALTLGKKGTLVATRDARRLIPAHPVEAVDATGAGDMFDGAFLAEWLKTGDPFAAADYANAAAALSTLGYGAIAPMPRRAAVEAFRAERAKAAG